MWVTPLDTPKPLQHWHEACKRSHHVCYHKHNVPMISSQQHSYFSKGARIINGFLSSMLHEYWKYWNNTKSFFLALKSFALTKWAMKFCDVANCKNNTNNQPTKKHFKSNQVVEIPQFHFESQVQIIVQIVITQCMWSHPKSKDRELHKSSNIQYIICILVAYETFQVEDPTLYLLAMVYIVAFSNHLHLHCNNNTS